MKDIMFWSESLDPRQLVGLSANVDSAIIYRAVSKLQSGRITTRYRGYATCRLCGQKLGSCDMVSGHWRFPEGAEHYILKHGVWYPDLDAFVGKVAQAIPGGLGQGKKPSSVDQDQLEKGIQVEREHVVGGGLSKKQQESLAQEIAIDHLSEIPDYYTRLEKMEDAARKKNASYFNVGDIILYGKYKNKKGKIVSFNTDPKGNPIVEIEPIPKGRKQNKIIQLFRIWRSDVDTMVSRVAADAKYKEKKKVPKADGKGTTTVYVYGPRQIQNRHKAKAEQVEKLRHSIQDLRKQLTKDLGDDDPKVRLTALAVGLIDATFERVGNDDSAEDGHYGVTGWLKKHLTFSKGKATIRYVGKSGVKHEKVVTDSKLVSALRGCCDDKKPDDAILSFGAEDTDGPVKITSRDVNEYLKPFEVTAKDLRGFHANREMQERLRAIRKKGPELPRARKEKDEILKKEFKQALEETAAEVGHESSTLRNQYLVPGLEDNYMHDGTVIDNLKDASVERVASRYLATKTPGEKEDDENTSRKSPKVKPPRYDSRRNRTPVDDPDLESTDKDTSMNYKDIGG